ncbi:lipopolysaccharide biosynthesis protein [Niabella aurantiaca]|uniref:lipopolysaccharide biosynthesis protein n=1 Tax=Niabella aurantiaca TaxID=379900 RepID=UPI00039A90C8|nr:oligosaccharide flippase family protein [Niabella aurantiaca]
MSGIKQLAGQTLWYGLSNVMARLLNFLLTPILTYLMVDSKGVKEYGDFSLLYAWIGVANIVYTYGLETGFFRFSNHTDITQKSLFNTTFASHIVSTCILSGVIIFYSQPISTFLEIGKFPEIIVITAVLIAFDTLATIPFAKLRQDNRPRRYAFIKVFGILVNIFLVILLVYLIPKYYSHTDNAFLKWILRQNRVTLLVVANMVQSFLVFLFLFPEWKRFRFRVNRSLWKQILRYSTPMIIIGLAGMVNEVMDRQLLKSFLPYSSDENMRIVGIYSANYKISIFITMFIQAFRMAGEPFFFKQKGAENARFTYAKVMKWFVITLCIAYLFTGLYLHIWQYMIGREYREGLYIVPILLMANVFLGIYYNLSAWYKLTDKMYWGIIITVIGALITFIGNYLFIPKYEMYAGATVTMICYGAMVVMAYLTGQKYYPIPYAWKKLVAYLVITVLLFLINRMVASFISNFWFKTCSATLFMGVFLFLVVRIEQNELKRLPLIGKFLR